MMRRQQPEFDAITATIWPPQAASAELASKKLSDWTEPSGQRAERQRHQQGRESHQKRAAAKAGIGFGGTRWIPSSLQLFDRSIG
jgi:hypothetical protein